MLDIGIQELAVIGVLALLIFGPDKLPELGRRLGRAMREFRRASDEFRSTVEQNLQMNVDPEIAGPSGSTSEPPAGGATDPAGAAAGAAPAAGAGPAGEGTAGGADGGPVDEEPRDPFWTSRGGRLLHRQECAWRARVPAAERIPLKTAHEGWEQGLKPCPACAPQEIPVSP